MVRCLLDDVAGIISEFGQTGGQEVATDTQGVQCV